MSSHYDVAYVIGGRCSERAVGDLAVAIRYVRAGPQFGEEFESPADAEAYIRAAIAAGEPLQLFKGEAQYGRCKTLEDCMKHHKLRGYRDAEGEPGAGWDRTLFRADDPHQPSRELVDDSPAVNLTTLRSALERGETLADVIAWLEVFAPTVPALSLEEVR